MHKTSECLCLLQNLFSHTMPIATRKLAVCPSALAR